MSVSKETLSAIAREVWGAEPAPADLEGALALLAPALEGLAELDALDLEPLEPALTFSLPAPVGAPPKPAARRGAGKARATSPKPA